MENKIIIIDSVELIANGILIQYTKEDLDSLPVRIAYTWDEEYEFNGEGNLKETKAIQYMLYDIMEKCGYINSKHKPFRINIDIEDQREKKEPPKKPKPCKIRIIKENSDKPL